MCPPAEFLHVDVKQSCYHATKRLQLTAFFVPSGANLTGKIPSDLLSALPDLSIVSLENNPGNSANSFDDNDVSVIEFAPLHNMCWI